MSKIIMIAEGEEDLLYTSAEGYRMERENGLTPNGNEINGRWVLRDPQGEWIDCDQFRNDLAEWYGLVLVRD
jgi:hypothetical protein